MRLLIISVLLSFFRALLPRIIQQLTTVIVRPTVSNVSKEIRQLENKIRSVNVREEFASYARLQRKLNKLKGDYTAEALERSQKKKKIGLILTYSLQALTTLASTCLFWTCRSYPVLVLDERWLSPFSDILSWPTGISGAVGFPVWFIITNTVANVLFRTRVN